MTISKNNDGVTRIAFNLDAMHYAPDAMLILPRLEFNEAVRALETAKRGKRLYWDVLCLHFANILIKSRYPIESQDKEACVYMVSEYLDAERKRIAAEYQRERYHARGGK